ncbi:MAG: glycosyltransferase family 4 protein [Saprospiraceae bacterium]
MKILHFSSAKTWRGGEQQIAYLYEELHKQQIQQWIFCAKGGALARYCQRQNIPHFTYQKRFSINPLVAYQFKKLSKELKIDLAHLHDSHSHTYGYISAILGNSIPFVLSRRVDFPVKDNWLSYQKYNHPSIKKILSVSNYVQRILAPAIKDQSKLQVVHSGVDTTRFKYTKQHILRKAYNILDKTKIIANVAAIAPHKDYFTFVDTAAILLKKPNENRYQFLIIGADGGEAEQIKRYIQEKGLSKQIILTGFRKDIPQILPEVDVFLFTSKEEGLGTSVIDALACGIPIVATKAGGIPEIIQDGKNGFLAPIKNAAQLAEKVEQLLLNPMTRKQFVENGKTTVLQFSKESTARKTLVVYEKIIQQASTQ